MQTGQMENIGSSLAKIFADASASSDCRDILPSQRSSDADVLERYGSREALFATFHVNAQSRHASAPLRCIMGHAPELETVNSTYGRETAEEWLMFQIVEFCEFVGARDKLTPYQLTQLCRLFVMEYGWLKLTDVELFFSLMKKGEFGRFYGAVDPQMFMQCVLQYLRRRNEILAEYYEEEERKRREREMQGTVTWAQFRAQYPDIEDSFDDR